LQENPHFWVLTIKVRPPDGTFVERRFEDNFPTELREAFPDPGVLNPEELATSLSNKASLESSPSRLYVFSSPPAGPLPEATGPLFSGSLDERKSCCLGAGASSPLVTSWWTAAEEEGVFRGLLLLLFLPVEPLGVDLLDAFDDNTCEVDND
jgi:hypothetical protein